MKTTQIKQMLFFTRPWQVQFHLELVKSLKKRFGDLPVNFATFFSLAKEEVDAAGYKCVYMPGELKKIDGTEITDERFAEIDRDLFEKQGVNFNLMLQSERYLPKKGSDAALFGRKHLVVIDRLVKEGTLFVSTAPDHFVYWLTGALANSRGGAHFSFSACGLPPGRVMALKTMWKTWQVPFKGDAKAFLEECKACLFLPAKERIEYLKPQKLPPIYKRFKQRYHEVKCEEKDTKAGSYFPGSKLMSLQTIKNRLPGNMFKHRRPRYDINDKSDLSSLKGSLCYLPLHMEPEATILMFSPWLRDQAEMCRLVSQALPVGWTLLVKENKAMDGDRPLKYYEKLRTLPNVLLVSPDVPSTDLIMASKFTVTLSGTAAVEAALLGKPSFVLGRPPTLHMLQDGDISASFSLANMFKQFERQEYSINLDEWASWVAGTFEARIVPVFAPDGSFCTPYDKKNVEAYSNYIEAALNFAS